MQEEVGITFVFVTHDQEEALSMSDRLAVMSDGRIEQVGTPREVYENPATVFVAEFLGVSNLMDAQVDRPRERRLHRPRRRVHAARPRRRRGRERRREDRRAARARHADARTRPGSTTTRCPGIVERTVYVGATIQVIVRLATGATMQSWVANDGEAGSWSHGTPVLAHLPPDAVRVLAPAR